MQPRGAVWEIQEVLGMPIVDGNYCVTIRSDHYNDLHQPVHVSAPHLIFALALAHDLMLHAHV